MINLLNALVRYPKDTTVLMLHAHADDESFLSAGTIIQLLQRGYRVVLVYLAVAIVPGEQKTVLRQKEIENACSVLGAVDVFFLEYCEPKYKTGFPLVSQTPNKVAQNILSLFEEMKIGKYILFSYDKNGGYGNQDHILVHDIGRLVAFGDKSCLDLFEVTIHRNIYNNWFDSRKTLSEPHLPKLEYWRKDFGLDESEISHIVDLSEAELSKKRFALAKHRSQIKDTEFPLVLEELDFRILFGKEFFTLIKKN